MLTSSNPNSKRTSIRPIRLLLLIGSLVLVALTALVLWSGLVKTQPDLPKELSKEVVPSSYPLNRLQPFVLPPPSSDPLQRIAQDEATSPQFINDLRTNPNANGIRFGVYGTSEMRQSDEGQSFWLSGNQPFEGVMVVETAFTQEFGDTNNFVFKVLLNGQTVNFQVEGSQLSDSLKLSLKRGERKLINFKTQSLPQGVHTLMFLGFQHADNAEPKESMRDRLGPASLAQQFYTLYVGTTEVAQTINFINWGVGKSKLPGLANIFAVNDGKLGEGIPAWEPQAVEPNAKVSYTALSNNPEEVDREYCLIVFMDYNQIPIEGNQKQVCGIVKGGDLGAVPSSFTAPSTPGNHYLQVLRIENPLKKDAYNQINQRVKYKPIESSSRFLIKVR